MEFFKFYFDAIRFKNMNDLNYVCACIIGWSIILAIVLWIVAVR